MSSLKEKISSKRATVGLIGMGYIGLSLLEAFGKAGFSLVGYDCDEKRVDMLKKGISYYNFRPIDFLFSLIKQGKFKPSSDPHLLDSADVLIISVPTSLDHHRLPDLSALKKAFLTVKNCLKKDQLIILQSTTYPGCTGKDLLPVLEASQMQVGKDFFLGHVPEISDPGQLDHLFTDIPRIVSGITPACRQITEALYQAVGCKTFPCPSTEVAEAAKILQNTYRLVNISLINEMKIMFDRMGIDVWEVIEAASQKPFGFTPFYPSPGIGGDCIPVVSSYLSWKAQETDGPSSLMDLAATVNLTIPHYVIDKLIEALNNREKTLNEAKILLLGVAYKKDINDLRESSSLKILSLLKQKKVNVDYNDPYIPELSNLKGYPDLNLKSIELSKENLASYDVVIIATDHSFYNWNELYERSKLIIDTRGALNKRPDPQKKTVKA